MGNSRTTPRRLRSTELLAVCLLLVAGAVAAAATAAHYGLSWDEPFFYAYADAVPYAYSPVNWVRPDFDLERAYGPSAADHKVYGPAYLLLARPAVIAMQRLASLDPAGAWHFVNALTFLFGVAMLYFLCRRWLSPWAAFSGTLLFTLQPMLWGHAFINPKDIPFLSFFLAAVVLGLWMVDRLCLDEDDVVEGNRGDGGSFVTRAGGWAARHAPWLLPLPTRPALFPPPARLGREMLYALLPAVALGIASSLRVLGPAAGLLVLVAFILQARRRALLGVALYALVAAATVYLTWPFLWQAPFQGFWQVIQRSAQNPTSLAVLFQGGLYRSDGLPRIYFPVQLGATLTEPVLLLSTIGLLVSVRRVVRRQVDWRTFIVVPLWFFAFAGYIVLFKPPMYDGIRHFLFILPPLFVFAAVALEGAFTALRPAWSRAALIVLVVVPGLYGIVETHPYEYAYYNQFAGRVGGAFRRFETEYWLTCYKEAVTRLNSLRTDEDTALYVFREPYIAEAYAEPSLAVFQLDPENLRLNPGDYLLLSSRSNEDRYFAEAPAVIVIGKGGATFCVVRQVGAPGAPSP